MLASRSVTPESVPVLVVGGGIVGLSAALFLAGHGVRPLLVEKHPDLLSHPRARGLLSRTVDAAGRTVETALTTTGGIVERTLDAGGGLLSTRSIGDITRLPLVRETTNTAGATVRRVRDTAGNVIEYVLDTAGAVSGVRLIERAEP